MEDSKATEESIILSNKSAVENLRKEKYDHAIFFLNQALLATKGMKDGTTKSNLLAMTYNNLGCYLKRLNKQSQALEYFNKSSELSKRFEINIANITCSHLNISKIHSEQGNHELALRHALKSLFLLRHNFANKNTLVSSLIIAYQTVGIEYKFLNQNPDSFECFETGLNLSMRHLGRNHEVTLALKKSLHELEGKSSRSQSNSSKKRDHVRGRSAGIQKIPSKLLEQKPAPYEQKTFQVEARPKVKTKEKILRRIGRAEIKAAVKLQRWWKKIVIKIRFNRKKLAAVKIQRWWRKIMGKKKAKVNFHRPRSVKRHVIKKNRAQGPSAPETKALISAKEKKIRR
jgi:tetratricopeptide (TPR) repeat protein